jgi:hypothetical protein
LSPPIVLLNVDLKTFFIGPAFGVHNISGSFGRSRIGVHRSSPECRHGT